MELKKLKTKFLGRKFEYYETIDSTQTEIWRRIENGNFVNGELIFSEVQTVAYGTHGRVWHNEKSGDISFSFAIQTDTCVDNLDGMTIEIAEIFKKIFEKYGVNIQIKLPNDLYLNGKKMGGILCQTKLTRETVKYLVIGIGININKMIFSEDIKDIATSVRKEIPNINLDNLDIVAEFCNIFEEKINSRIGEK